jgi:hypothetical protein
MHTVDAATPLAGLELDRDGEEYWARMELM